MSVEVDSMKYLFKSRQRGRRTPLEWFYNPIHDLESVWWLFTWSTLNRDIYFVRRTLESGSDAAVPSTSPGVITRSRRRLREILSGNDIEADADQIVPLVLKQETKAARVQRVKRQHALASALFSAEGTHETRLYILLAENTLDDEIKEKAPLHPVIRILGEHLCAGRDLLVDGYRKAEGNLARLSKKASKVADGLHDQLKDIFDEANQYIGGLGVDIGVRKLSTEHERILEAEKIAKERWEAEHAEELARLRAEGVWRLFFASKNQNDDSSKSTSQPPSRRRKGNAGSSDEGPRKRIHTIPSVPEDPEIDTCSGAHPGPGP